MSEIKKELNGSQEPERNVYTICDKELGTLTKKEQELMDADWSGFKEDVSMKTLVN